MEPTKSQRMAWNNDGMDPDWKPEPEPEIKLVQLFKGIYYRLAAVSMRFDKWTDEELDRIEKENKVLTTQFSADEVRKIRKLVKEAR